MILSEHAYEQEALTTRFASSNSAKHPQLCIGITRSNFFKLDRLIALQGSQLGKLLLSSPKTFPVRPLATIRNRFEAYLAELTATRYADGSLLDLVVADPKLREFLSAVEKALSTCSEKEILLAMGPVCDHAFTGPERVLLDPSTVCNIDCIYCRTFSPTLNPGMKPHSGKREHPDLRTLSSFFADLAKLEVRTVSIVGGAEPLTYPDFAGLVTALTAAGLEFDLCTNGTLLSPALAELLVSSGRCTSITISISAADQQTYGVIHPKSQGRWNSLLGNIRALHQLKKEKQTSLPTTSFLFAICNKNYKAIPAAARLAAELGFDYLRFQMLHVDPWNAELALSSEQRTEVDTLLLEAKTLAGRSKLKWDTFIEPQQEHYQPEQGSWSDFLDATGCLVGWYFSYLSFRKQVMFCCGQKEVGALDGPQEDFASIWQSERYRFMRQGARIFSKEHQIISKNGALLRDSFCRCCDNHNFNQSMLTLLESSGLAPYMDKALDQALQPTCPVVIEALALADQQTTDGTGDTVTAGVPWELRIAYRILKELPGTALRLTLATENPARTVYEVTIPLDCSQRRGIRHAVIALSGTDILDDLGLQLKVDIGQGDSDTFRIFKDSGKSLKLRVLSPRRLGGGLLGLAHSCSLRNADLLIPLKRGFRKEWVSKSISLSSFSLRKLGEHRPDQPQASHDNEPETSLAVNAGIELRYQLSFFTEAVDPLFRIRFLLKDPKTGKDVFLFGTNNYRHKLRLGRVLGNVRFIVTIPRLALPPGTYAVVMNVLQDESPEATCFFEHAQTMVLQDTAGRQPENLLPLRIQHSRLNLDDSTRPAPRAALLSKSAQALQLALASAPTPANMLDRLLALTFNRTLPLSRPDFEYLNTKVDRTGLHLAEAQRELARLREELLKRSDREMPQPEQKHRQSSGTEISERRNRRRGA